MQTQTVHAPSAPAMDFARQPKDFATQDVTLRHLKTPAEIATVLHLRGGIDLSAHTAAGADEFARLEKKETSAASSTHST
jgi:hypothetical protein